MHNKMKIVGKRVKKRALVTILLNEIHAAISKKIYATEHKLLKFA